MRNLAKRYFLLSMIFFTLSLFLGVQADASSINLEVNGQTLDSEETLVLQGRTYVPVREVTELLGAEVKWNKKLQEVVLIQGDKIVKFEIGKKKVYRNDETLMMDAPAVVEDGSAFVPVRFVSEALHYNVDWDKQTNTILITEKPTYLVEKGDTLSSISEKTGVSISDLKAWNQITDDLIVEGSHLVLEDVNFSSVNELKANAVVSYQDEEFEWLAKIIHLEAMDEPYEGRVAVGAVVINRVQSSQFPNSIKDVIFAPGQFTPAGNGKIYNTTPSDSDYKAAKEALSGTDPVEGALYFYNPKVSTSTFFNSKSRVGEIGGHRFVK